MSLIFRVTEKMPVLDCSFNAPPFVDDFGNEWKVLMTGGNPRCFTPEEAFDDIWAEEDRYDIAPLELLTMERLDDGMIADILFLRRECMAGDPVMRDVA